MTVTVTDHQTGTTVSSSLPQLGQVLREGLPVGTIRETLPGFAAIDALEAKIAAGRYFGAEAAVLGVTIDLS